jgi:hypothetical protein
LFWTTAPSAPGNCALSNNVLLPHPAHCFQVINSSLTIVSHSIVVSTCVTFKMVLTVCAPSWKTLIIFDNSTSLSSIHTRFGGWQLDVSPISVADDIIVVINSN